MRYVVILIACKLIWLTNLCSASPVESMRFKRLLHGSADTDEVINAIHVTRQDPNGFIWFGGEHGLARYDGHEIKIYQHTPENSDSLTSNVIWDIVFDHDGIMWLATDYGLGRYNAASDTFTSFRSQGFDTNSITGNSVRSLAVDQKNNLLIGTDNGFNILDPSRKHYLTYTDRPNDRNRLPNAGIQAILVEPNGDVWLGTTSSGLLRLTLKPFSYDIFAHDPKNPKSISHNRVTDIIRDHTGALWVSTFGGGISRMNKDQKTFARYTNNPNDEHSLGSNTVWSLYEDSFNNFWVATDHGGLALFERDKNNFSHLRHNPYDDSSLSSNNIRSVFEDNHGDLWIGAFPIGTNFFDRSSTVFDNFTHIPGINDSLINSTILTIRKSQQGHLWMGTEGGINLFDPISKKSTAITAKPGVKGALQSNAVLSIAEQQNGDLWVGTWSGGLHRKKAGKTFFEQFMPVSDDLTIKSTDTVNSAYIWSLLIDSSQKNLWIGTETGGINRFNFATQKFTHYLAADPAGPENVSNSHIWTIIEDKSGVIWAGSMHGLNKYNADSDTFSHFFHSTSNTNSLGNNRVTALFEDSNDNLWIGTQGGGISILSPMRQHFRHLTVDDGLPSDNVASIIEAPNGNIWATTDKGAANINPADSTIKKYQKSHGLIGNNFNRDASYIDEDGLIYLGSTEGLSIFKSDNIIAKETPPNIAFTDFRLFNESVTANSKNSPLSDAIQNTKSITLNYDQRFFSIGFSALSYRSSNRNQYAYKLEGFDKDWNEVGNRHIANYTNISPGHYTFHVKAANAGGLWNEKGAKLSIYVKPPILQTWWAYSLYFLAVVALLWAYSRHKAKRLELQKERDVNAKLIKLDKMKDAFLANTSHELRTPLNGIIGLAEALRDSCSEILDPGKVGQLGMIVSSGKRLSHLINDILDLSKLADRNIELKNVDIDLRNLTDTVISLLSPLVGIKPIRLQNEIPDKFYAVFADENRLQQIMFNLIGNAIKYSDKGYVKINAHQDNKTTTICVKDTGIGINPEDIETIFQSFSQLEHSDAREYGGTGLGLAITKQLIELHGGKINVVSHPGKGTTFIFTMPTSTQLCERIAPPIQHPIDIFQASDKQQISLNKAIPHKQTNDKVEPKKALEQVTTEALKAKITASNDVETSTVNASKLELLAKIPPLPNADQITILSVDDDPINRMVLNGILKLHSYNVLEADNGQSAIEMVNRHPEIDLIILDVMMPKMTGYEACEALRVMHPIYELPIIFLTAKDIERELSRGFLSGGNDFVNKPVKKEELLARIKAQLTLLMHARELGNKNSTAISSAKPI